MLCTERNWINTPSQYWHHVIAVQKRRLLASHTYDSAQSQPEARKLGRNIPSPWELNHAPIKGISLTWITTISGILQKLGAVLQKQFTSQFRGDGDGWWCVGNRSDCVIGSKLLLLSANRVNNLLGPSRMDMAINGMGWLRLFNYISSVPCPNTSCA